MTEFAFPSGINVTDAMTGAEQPLENPSYVSTTWDFAWSSGGNISQALGNSTGPLCVSILDIVAYQQTSPTFTRMKMRTTLTARQFWEKHAYEPFSEKAATSAEE